MRPAAGQGQREDGQVESFGARLKREREQRKITLDDISISTKIAPRFLLALEEEQFDQLPGGIFNKGFVRAYARHLGLDENQAIADFVAASQPSLPEIPQEAPELAAMAVRVPEARSRRSEGGVPWGLFAIGLLVLAFCFAIWGFYARDKSTKPSVSVRPLVHGEPSTVAAQEAAPEMARTAPTDTASQASQLPPSGASTGVPEAATPITTTAANTGFFQVVINPREDSWVSITADGKPVIQDTLTAPTEKSIEARNQIVIKTGNVGALDISFNGKKLAPQGRHNEVKTLTFDANGLRP
jgi:cytoskeleton protein RodZ